MHDLDQADGERFWSNVRVAPGCWMWLGPINRKRGGYGIFRDRDRRILSAHRVAFRLATGIDPVGSFVLHRCDVPACVNPAHLVLGTNEDNMADMRAKGRKRLGGQHARARLSDEQRDAMRADWKAGGVSKGALARRYGVSHQTVLYVLVGEAARDRQREERRRRNERREGGVLWR